jgi:hypothetical protein
VVIFGRHPGKIMVREFMLGDFMLAQYIAKSALAALTAMF